MVAALALAAVLLTSSRADNQNKQFEDQEYASWMRRYGKSYAGNELSYRMEIYRANSQAIERHNKEAQEGRHTYTMEANRFASLTDEEYRLLHTLKRTKRSISSHCNSSIEDTPEPKPEIDWTKRAVTPVKSEGACAASWAFAAVGALEGLYAIDKSKLVSLSAQQLVDCSADYGNEGCSGGLMDQGLWYVMDSGIATQDQYAYTGKAAKCQYKPTMQIYKVRDCAEVPSENYSKLVSAVNQQPVAVAVASSQFKFYKEGVYSGDCGEDIDAGVIHHSLRCC